MGPRYRHAVPKQTRKPRLGISGQREKGAAPSRPSPGVLLARRTAVLACLGVLAGFGFAGLASAGFMVPGSGTGSALVHLSMRPQT